MSNNQSTIHPRYIINERGDRTEVILKVNEFNALIEELEDLYDVLKAERVLAKDDQVYSLEDIKKSLLGK